VPNNGTHCPSAVCLVWVKNQHHHPSFISSPISVQHLKFPFFSFFFFFPFFSPHTKQGSDEGQGSGPGTRFPGPVSIGGTLTRRGGRVAQHGVVREVCSDIQAVTPTHSLGSRATREGRKSWGAVNAIVHSNSSPAARPNASTSSGRKEYAERSCRAGGRTGRRYKYSTGQIQ